MEDIDKVINCLEECADDLEGCLKYYYTEGVLHHDVMKRKYNRDMEPVLRARKLIETYRDTLCQKEQIQNT